MKTFLMTFSLITVFIILFIGVFFIYKQYKRDDNDNKNYDM